MTPADVLAAARELLQRPAPAGAGGWQRAVALLTRQALEQAIEEFWAADPATAGLREATRKMSGMPSAFSTRWLPLPRRDSTW